VVVEIRVIQDLSDRLRVLRISAVVFDFDGVFTDNRVLTLQDGTEVVFCSRSDGMGIELLRSAGIPMVVISKERNPVTTARCTKLGLEVLQGVDDKVPAMTAWLAERNLDLTDIIYVGNDVNELPCMRLVGCAVAVADSHPSVLAEAEVLDLARQMIDAAAVAGCDAVKFQKRTPELCVPVDQRDILGEIPWGTMTYLDYRYRVEFGVPEYDAIDAQCRELGIDWFASPWDEPSVGSCCAASS